MAVFATLLVVAAGVAIMQYFDARTGKFILSVAPVIALLVIVISGAWRRADV